jgi:hypothetical protein
VLVDGVELGCDHLGFGVQRPPLLQPREAKASLSKMETGSARFDLTRADMGIEQLLDRA